MLSTIGLMITSFIIWREQNETQAALLRETAQRTKADESFRQALSAVETFNQLSESELASRPELQDLRRNFLETSLSFYRDFQQQRGDDPTVASMLEKTSERVEQMVRELQLLNSVAPMLMLGDAQVRQDLKLDKPKAQQVAQAVNQFQTERQSLSNKNIGTLLTDNHELSELLTEFDSFIRKQLTDQQIERLFQISRQSRLPFTFKTSEVIKALQLSQSQRDTIDRIIEETRPRGPRGPGGMQDGFQRNRFAPEMNGRRPSEFDDGPREFKDRPESSEALHVLPGDQVARILAMVLNGANACHRILARWSHGIWSRRTATRWPNRLWTRRRAGSERSSCQRFSGRSRSDGAWTDGWRQSWRLL